MSPHDPSTARRLPLGSGNCGTPSRGGNWNNDWWQWEHTEATVCVEPSGDACDHFHRYPDDIALLASLGFNAYRFSVEWSRLEPEQGEWSSAAAAHYRRVCTACHDNGITPVVTFHHFTTPRWVAASGGWEDRSTAELFARFCGRAVASFGDMIGAACTINEPNIVALMGFRFWVLGYRPTFGLVAVDRDAPFERHPKPSATWLGG